MNDNGYVGVKEGMQEDTDVRRGLDVKKED